MADETRKVTIRFEGTDASGPAFSSVKRNLDDIKESFGRGSEFQETFELLKGGGAALGLKVAGEVLDNFASKAVELKDKFNEGKISAGEMVEEIAKGLPIFGGLVSAGREIHEFITGEEADTRRVLENAKAIGEAVDKQRESWAKTSEVIKQLSEQAENFGLAPSVGAAEGKANAAGFDARIAALNAEHKKTEESLSGRNSEAQKTLTGLQDEGGHGVKFQRKLKEAQDEVKVTQDAIDAENRAYAKQIADLEKAKTESAQTIAERSAAIEEAHLQDYFKKLQDAEDKNQAEREKDQKEADARASKARLEIQAAEAGDMEKFLRERRQSEMDQAKQDEEEARKIEGARPSGIAHAQLAGLTTGAARSENPLQRPTEKIVSATERTAKAMEEFLKQRRQSELQVATF